MIKLAEQRAVLEISNQNKGKTAHVRIGDDYIQIATTRLVMSWKDQGRTMAGKMPTLLIYLTEKGVNPFCSFGINILSAEIYYFRDDLIFTKLNFELL